MPVTRDSSAPLEPTLRIPHLDGVRALAALFVVVHHCYCMAYPPGYGVEVSERARPFVGWALYGHFGVTVFIVLAGFSLGLGLSSVDGSVIGGLRAFAVRRARRILPPYWIAIAVTIVLVLTVIGTRTGTHWDLSLPIDPKGWLVDALLLQDVAFVMPVGNVSYPFWSISVEWHIYLLIPVIVLLRRRLPWATVLGLLTVLAAVGVALGQLHPAIRYLQPAYYLLFVLGVAASLLVRRVAFDTLRVPWAAAAAVLACAVIALCAGHSFAWFSDSLWWLDVVAGGAVLCGLLALQRKPRGILARTLAATPFRRAAASSYTLYLLHAPLLQLFWQAVALPAHLPRSMQLALGWGVAVPAIVVICAMLSRVIEQPFIKRRARARTVDLPTPAIGTPRIAGGRVPTP